MAMTFYLKWIQTLLPKSRAFNLGNSKAMTKLFESIAFIVDLIRDHIAEMLLEVYPATATVIAPWVKRLNLPLASTLAVIEAEWADSGAISPHHLQQRLQAAGYDAYVHEFWDPTLSPGDVGWIRNPVPHIEVKKVISGTSFIGGDNLLVNDHVNAYPNYTMSCGNLDQSCGNLDHSCGQWAGEIFDQKGYLVNELEVEYPAYFYVCGPTWPDPFYTDQNLQELKRLIYKIKPVRLRCVLITETIGGKLDRIDGGGYEDPQTGVEYYSPEQHNDRYGTVIRQYWDLTNTPSGTEIYTGVESVVMLGGALLEGDTDLAPTMTGNGGAVSATYAVPTGVQVDLDEPILYDALGAGSLKLIIANDMDEANDNFKFWIDYTRVGI